ncbi:hypothetical protein [Marinomonas foliarum]|uniref:Uncharacterized protein n=1 Tax=Marinomonas foliarum TaxID=491950 RepID=A0ABX7IP49_9GAMM|nr:hypothetical protein [Marinomonas foliarum]QRV23824.1 hypothetical protein JSY38_17705 [Marinomonas foliarum]
MGSDKKTNYFSSDPNRFIHLTPTGNPSYDQQLSDQVIERLKAEFAQGMMGNMDVATRADGSLTDKRTS